MRELIVAALVVCAAGCDLMTMEEVVVLDGGARPRDSGAETEDTEVTPFNAAGRPKDCALDRLVSSSATIGRAGGRSKLVGGWEPHGVPFSISVPPGALSDTVTITVSEIFEVPSPGVSLISPVYAIEPFGISFARPVDLIVTMPKIPDGEVPPFVAYSAPDGGTSFVVIPDSHINAGFVNATITQTGFFFTALRTNGIGTICR